MVNHWSHKLDSVGESPSSRALRSGHARVTALVLAVSEESVESQASVPELILFARNSQVQEVRECIERATISRRRITTD